MCTLDRYLYLEQKNGQTWSVMPEDLEDILRAVKKFNEANEDYDGGDDELLELRTITGARLWTLASSIATVNETTLESRARNMILDERMTVDVEEEKQRILRAEAHIRAVTG